MDFNTVVQCRVLSVNSGDEIGVLYLGDKKD